MCCDVDGGWPVGRTRLEDGWDEVGWTLSVQCLDGLLDGRMDGWITAITVTRYSSCEIYFLSHFLLSFSRSLSLYLRTLTLSTSHFNHLLSASVLRF